MDDLRSFLTKIVGAAAAGLAEPVGKIIDATPEETKAVLSGDLKASGLSLAFSRVRCESYNRYDGKGGDRATMTVELSAESIEEFDALARELIAMRDEKGKAQTSLVMGISYSPTPAGDWKTGGRKSEHLLSIQK